MPPKRDRRLKDPADKVKAVSFSISQRDLDVLIKLGNGNASAGVRLLLAQRKGVKSKVNTLCEIK